MLQSALFPFSPPEKFFVPLKFISLGTQCTRNDSLVSTTVTCLFAEFCLSVYLYQDTSNRLAVAISALPRLGAFAKLRKATPSFISVRPSVRAQHLSSH
jgi:hypothetical protein